MGVLIAWIGGRGGYRSPVLQALRGVACQRFLFGPGSLCLSDFCLAQSGPLAIEAEMPEYLDKHAVREHFLCSTGTAFGINRIALAMRSVDHRRASRRLVIHRDMLPKVWDQLTKHTAVTLRGGSKASGAKRSTRGRRATTLQAHV